jgi:hypothetical protein
MRAAAVRIALYAQFVARRIVNQSTPLSPAARAFDSAQLDRLWASLADDVRYQIITKAKWERAPRAAVIRHWWPELWTQIAITG